jgi:hypothetical protein
MACNLYKISFYVLEREKMIYELRENHYDKVRPLIKGKQDIHVHLLGVVDKNNRGKIYVDNIETPRTAIIWAIGCMYFIIGDNDNRDFNSSLNEYINKVLGPDSLSTCGGTHFAVTLHEDKWIETLEDAFMGRKHLHRGLEYVYTFNSFKYENLDEWKSSVTQGYTVQRITRDIIDNDTENLISSDILGDFWISVDKFLEKGIGFCVLKGNKIISSCFSGYVSDHFHDIVIRTYGEENRRKGFATIAARAFVDYCVCNDLIPHWRTDELNKGSIATADKCGFELYKKYRLYVFPFE